MKTFILFWNPAISNVKLENWQMIIDNEAIYDLSWSVWEHDQAHEGDRFFMVRCGDGNTGICASGRFGSDPYKGEDWSGKGREVYYADLDVDVIIDPVHCPVLSTETLLKEIPDFDWTGGHSGRVLPHELYVILESLWCDFLAENDYIFQKHALKQNAETMVDDDDDMGNDYPKHYAVISTEKDGRIVISPDGMKSSKLKVEAWTLDEAKEKYKNNLSNHGVGDEDIYFWHDCVNAVMQELYDKALSIASLEHRYQYDKAGKPYIGHPVRVAERCESAEAKIVALLHDVLEDTEVTPIQLKEAGFPHKIIDAVLSVTKQNDESYEDFIKRAARNKIGREVKIADLEDNMDIRRLEEIGEWDVVRLKKYLKAWRYLQ